MKYSEAIVHTTFKCNMRCPKCTQRVFRIQSGDYMMTMKQFIEILERTKGLVNS
ncbi:unnamed protein product, partial [marine sediment metagenome]